MLYATILVCVAALTGLGAVLYRSGRRVAENEALKAKERENAKVDKTLRRVAVLNRVDLLARLREHKK